MPNPDNRCNRNTNAGQCTNPAAPGYDVCEKHGAHAMGKDDTRMYELAQAEHRGLYGKLADREDLLSLRAEVALARMALQRLVNLSSADSDFEAKLPVLNSMLLTVKGIVSECVKVEKSAGLTVDRAALLQFAGDVINICSEEVADLPGSQALLERIASRIIDAVNSAGENSNEVE